MKTYLTAREALRDRLLTGLAAGVWESYSPTTIVQVSVKEGYAARTRISLRSVSIVEYEGLPTKSQISKGLVFQIAGSDALWSVSMLWDEFIIETSRAPEAIGGIAAAIVRVLLRKDAAAFLQSVLDDLPQHPLTLK